MHACNEKGGCTGAKAVHEATPQTTPVKQETAGSYETQGE
jgi:hypothetical protein